MKICPACASAHDASGWVCPICHVAPPVEDGIPLLAPAIKSGDGTDATYSLEALAAAEQKHFWFRNRAELVAWAIREHFPAARSLLDVGCGTGGILASLGTTCANVALTGGDALLDALRYARARVRDVELLQLDIRSLPFERHFDLISAFDVLEHLDDDQHVLQEMRKAVRDGGGLLVTVPQHPELWSRVDDFSRHRRRYRRRELIDRVQRAGFSVRLVTSFTTMMLPAMALSRLLDGRRVTPFDPVAELNVGAAVNAVGSILCAVERTAISHGISWPAGGSLLLLATKA